jgi:hypothetical protein
MASSGPNYPTTQTEIGSGNSWTNPSRAAGSPNDQGATLALDGVSKKLRTGPYGLGFSIPAGATIDGIKVTVLSRGGVIS